MGCDFNSLGQQTQPWNWQDPKVILAGQILLMCDALNGIDPTTELNPIALAGKVNCFAALSQNQLMGIWTVLWAQFLKIMAAGGSGGQILSYVNDPNAEGVKPLNLNAPALAYPASTPGGGTTFQWIIPQQKWA